MSSPFEKDETKGDPIEHLSVGVSEFMAQKETQVRRAIQAFNRLAGTNLQSTLEIEAYSNLHEGELEYLNKEAEEAWQDYLSSNRQLWTTLLHNKLKGTFYWACGISLVLGGAIGYAIGKGF